MLRKIVRKLKRKLNNWWNNLWFNEMSREMSREFARVMDRACQCGIDFGPEPIENLLKYWCRDTRKTWHRFFINWKQYDDELEHIAFVRSYE